MKLARTFLLFSYGLFTIAAQSLIFREFITTFEGNDISIGIFFGSWFLWVGAGAVLVNTSHVVCRWLTRYIEILLLCYLPAFFVQFLMVVQAREIAGLESYALWSFRDILLTSFIVNAPLSLITGLLFPTACRWIAGDRAVSQVYVIEAAGSFAGGIGITVLLWRGVDPVAILLMLAAIISTSVFAVRFASVLEQRNTARKTACLLSFVPPAVCIVLVVLGAGNVFSGRLQAIKWQKLLSEGAPAGSFRTAQTEYLYGSYRGQWVVLCEGSTCEALPDKAAAGQTAAISLCQNPTAEAVLVVGSGLGVCGRFLDVPRIKKVTWAYPDGGYARMVEAFIPADLRVTDSRFERLGGDLRRVLADGGRSYDIVVVDLPDATSSVLNRYYTVEFYDQIKRSLRPGGVIAVRAAGGENVMGTELINLGASIRLTLKEVFSRLVLTPGEDTWFIASDSEALTSDPAVLRDRFRSIDGAEAILPPEALLSIYLPDRAEAALEIYARADLPAHLLINRDSRPLAHLYSLLLAAKRSGTPLTRLAKLLTLGGPLIFLVPVFVFVVLRLAYVLTTKRGSSQSGFDSTLLVFSAGAVGIGTVIVLMYLYQTYFGSLYLHIGVISSLYMVGLTIAAAAAARLVAGTTAARVAEDHRPELLLLIVVAVHAVVLAGIALAPAEYWTRAQSGVPWQSGHGLFAAAFLMCGLCGGCYFPIAARRLAEGRLETGRIGGRLEAADHLGAAVGGVVTSLILVPVLGAKAVLPVFIMLMAANVPAVVVMLFVPRSLYFTDTPSLIFRRLGYVLLGAAGTLIVCSNILAMAGARLMPSVPRQTAQALVGGLSLQQVSAMSETIGREIDYFNVVGSDPNAAGPAGFVFSSEDLAPNVRGFGGRMNLAVYMDTAGKLIDFQMVRSNETPSYLKLLTDWQERLKGHNLLGAGPLGNVDAVSGATASSQAILRAFRDSAGTFARDIRHLSAQPAPGNVRAATGYLPDARAGYLIGAAALSLVVICAGGLQARLIVLAATCVIGGFVLNVQYSTEQIASLLSMHMPAAGLSGAFMLAAGIPLLVALFGNIYCGYICPFGAAQELLGYLVPQRLRPPLAIEKMQTARFAKYIVLSVLMVGFFLSRDRTTLSADPLIHVFGVRVADMQWLRLNWRLASTLILAGALVGSVVYPRFWCRYLCPAGAFLSLFNKVSLLRRLLPAKRFGRCGFGLTAGDRLDCIHCDRCRHLAAATKPVRPAQADAAKAGLLSLSLTPIVVAAAILTSAVSLDRLVAVLPGYEDYTVSVASAGQPRDVDLQRIEGLIRQKRLSDREAVFYKKLD